ncbi:small acid-soluble spore protein Tlp [Bacillus fonticola]|uniref:small acid-soluble spore protein Tlp n=1 Tax=Bacillus fonticola TaxID=2728853 RepID=UPI0014764D94|nr:small acid-soluble spore protein Tlp [Bacillus fonticola]
MFMDKPNPDDRSDNVENLQSAVQHTIENMEKAEETLEFSTGEEKQAIQQKNERRRESIDAMRSEIKDEAAYQQQQGKQ